MNREQTNLIRSVLEDWVPPVLRDSSLFRAAAKVAWGEHIDRLTDFRKRAPFLTEAEYEALYHDHPRVHEGTDNSQACIRRILADVEGESICDVGCGTGDLLRRLREARGNSSRLVGVDIIANQTAEDGIEFVAAKIERLPFQDSEFDTVICTHVIEHLLDYRAAINELRRIAAKRLIIVVPREREYLYTFNPHFNFFPYTHSFLRAMHPIPLEYVCCYIGRDIYYCEHRDRE